MRGFYTDPSRADDCFVPFTKDYQLAGTYKAIYGGGYVTVDLSDYDVSSIEDIFIIPTKIYAAAAAGGSQTANPADILQTNLSDKVLQVKAIFAASLSLANKAYVIFNVYAKK